MIIGSLGLDHYSETMARSSKPETILELLAHIPQVGRLEWIGVSAGNRAKIEALERAEVSSGTGLDLDYHARSGRSKRQVTLIQAEHLAVIASLVGRPTIEPDLLRRNLVVSGINLLALKDTKFRIGDVLLEGTGICTPCSRMEEALGSGGYNAMRGHGGITARVLSSGEIKIGDEVRWEQPTPQLAPEAPSS
jgi:MOSC domain-containing protein YiiM